MIVIYATKLKLIILRILQTSVLPTPVVEESSQYRSLAYRATEVIAFVVFVFLLSFIFFVNALIPSIDYKDGYEFHVWIPLMESRFGIRLFLYIRSKNKIMQ
jgi:hypothetical protein